MTYDAVKHLKPERVQTLIRRAPRNLRGNGNNPAPSPDTKAAWQAG